MSIEVVAVQIFSEAKTFFDMYVYNEKLDFLFLFPS